jgi:Spy/CpxP family protein refolding chaperone
MNRRQMVVLPGVALAASRGFAQTEQSAASPSSSGTVSHKAVAHYSSPKSSYKIPKSGAKQAKYIGFLTTLLSLAPNQQAQAAAIFANASASDAEAKKNIKAARKHLSETVTNNDSARMQQMSASIGTLAAQRHLIGASANAAFFQLLTADQQAKLNQFRS